MGKTLKQQILQAEWEGYRWGLQHPKASKEAREKAGQEHYPNINSGVLSFAFERGAVMALEGRKPEALEEDG